MVVVMMMMMMGKIISILGIECGKIIRDVMEIKKSIGWITNGSVCMVSLLTYMFVEM